MAGSDAPSGSNELWVDPDGLRDSIPRFEIVAEDLEQVRSRIEASMDADSGAWGRDDVGSLFARDYEPGAESGVESLTSLIDAVYGVAEAMAKTLAEFEKTDRDLALTLGGVA